MVETNDPHQLPFEHAINDRLGNAVSARKVVYRALLMLLGGLLSVAVVGSVAISLILLHRLVDCTTPGGKCYEQGRSATSGAVGTINKVTVLAVACAKAPRNNTLDKIQQCVLNGLN